MASPTIIDAKGPAMAKKWIKPKPDAEKVVPEKELEQPALGSASGTDSPRRVSAKVARAKMYGDK